LEIRNQKNQFRNVITDIISNNIEEVKLKKKKELSNQIYLLYEGAVSESFLHGEIWPIESAKSICKILID